MNRVYLMLGSNIEKERNLPAAIELLRGQERIIDVSSVYETKPRGTHAQPNFFNAAVLIETDATPVQIKDEIIGPIEQKLKRKRQADKNAPRTIDIDIALYNDAIVDYTPADGRPRHIPDEDLLRSLHAIVPVAELAGDLPHPETGELLEEIAARLRAADDSGDLIWVREDVQLEV